MLRALYLSPLNFSGGAPRLSVLGHKSARLARLIAETERQLERSLTHNEHRWLMLYVEATPEEEDAESHGAGAS